MELAQHLSNFWSQFKHYPQNGNLQNALRFLFALDFHKRACWVLNYANLG